MSKNKLKRSEVPDICIAKTKKYNPALIDAINELVTEYHESDISDDCCLCSNESVGKLTTLAARYIGENDRELELAKRSADSILRLVSIGWGYSRGIYDLDKTMVELLTKTGIGENTPTDVLKRLPEWVTYIKTPGLVYNNVNIESFYVSIIHDISQPDSSGTLIIETIIQETVDTERVRISLSLDRDTINKCVRSRQDDIKVRFVFNKEYDDIGEKFISIILYVIENAVVHKKETSATTGSYSSNKPVIKLADKTRIFQLGRSESAKYNRHLKLAKEEASNKSKATGIKVTPHLRRGHWHGYWYGSKDNKDLRLKWVAPTFIGQ